MWWWKRDKRPISRSVEDNVRISDLENEVKSLREDIGGRDAKIQHFRELMETSDEERDAARVVADIFLDQVVELAKQVKGIAESYDWLPLEYDEYEPTESRGDG